MSKKKSKSKSDIFTRRSLASKRGWVIRKRNQKGAKNESTPVKRKNPPAKLRNKRNKTLAKQIAKKNRKNAKQRKTPVKKRIEKRVKKKQAVSKRGKRGTKRSSKPVRSKSVRKRGTGTKRKTSSKSAVTKRLDRKSVFKIKSGKTPSKGYGFILFESTSEITPEIVQDIIDRALLESDKPLLQVRLTGKIKGTDDERGFSSRMFPVYLDTLPERKFYGKSDDTPDGMAESICFEVQAMEAFYDVEADSYEYFIMWE